MSHAHESSEEHDKSSGWSSARQRLSKLFGLRRRSKRTTRTPPITMSQSVKMKNEYRLDLHSNQRIPYSPRSSNHDSSSENSNNESNSSCSNNEVYNSCSSSDKKRLPGHSHRRSNRNNQTESSSSPSSPSSDDEADERTINARIQTVSWRTWFLSRPGYSRLLLKIPDEYLADEFNFADLVSGRPAVRELLSRIIGSAIPGHDPIEEKTGNETNYDSFFKEELEKEKNQQPILEFLQPPQISDAIQLYFLLHARYIQTREGLLRIANRYSRGDFGICPRFNCVRERLLPVGLSDLLGEARIQRYCPSCNDIYHWSSERYWNIDGAAYGTSFPHFFFLSFPSFVRQVIDGDYKDYSTYTSRRIKCTLPPSILYEPKIFGFKLLQIGKKELVAHDGSSTQIIESPHDNLSSFPHYDSSVGIGKALRSLPNYHRCLCQL